MAVITISRQAGSGGHEIARQVCDALGYSYFDKILLAKEAIQTGLTESEIIDFSEENYKAKTLLERLFSPGVRILASTPVRIVDETGIEKKYTRHLDERDCIAMIRAVICAAYERGNIVIVGRGGQVILQKKPDVLHVRVIAPPEVRVRRLQVREGCSVEAAREIIRERDKATEEYLERFFKVRWDDPTLYNLTIDTGEHSIETATKQVVETVKALAIPL